MQAKHSDAWDGLRGGRLFIAAAAEVGLCAFPTGKRPGAIVCSGTKHRQMARIWELLHDETVSFAMQCVIIPAVVEFIFLRWSPGY